VHCSAWIIMLFVLDVHLQGPSPFVHPLVVTTGTAPIDWQTRAE
jgi:hypothetical protein